MSCRPPMAGSLRRSEAVEAAHGVAMTPPWVGLGIGPATALAAATLTAEVHRRVSD